ncbi:MAG TPA: hypothetical protein VH088_02090 [Terriglobales bacterium]|jgi:hypothetical protein|nr:hypothetical protein [Terriglobales bacterium]
MSASLSQWFRCPKKFECIASKKARSNSCGYFLFGKDATCFGSHRAQRPSPSPADALYDALDDVVIDAGEVSLSFDPSQVLDNLYHETYVDEWREGSLSALSKIYYFIRPVLPVAVRRHLQKLYLKDWKTIRFPSWPVDCSVDKMMDRLLLLSLRASGADRIPFIWYWPEGKSSCAIMTHDVETQAGYEFCPALMDLDDEFGVKASFQIIPEERYAVHREMLAEIRRRGFEVCVHDLNHDGHLYKNREQFLLRAARINEYGKEFAAEGFRAAVLYRKQLWYDALKFSFDMSVPNVAHLDPQRGGCCTVKPYFFQNGILEIPVTMSQDYTLYNILRDYSTTLWKQQSRIVMENHGCMSFIVHPDYVLGSRERGIFRELLAYIDSLRRDCGVWITTPGELNRWWRQRSAMTLVEDRNGWRIEGGGADKARIAWASEQDGQLVFSFDDCPTAKRAPETLHHDIAH